MIPRPVRARVDASEQAWRTCGSVEVVYLGQHAIVLRAGDRLVPITRRGAGVMPGGVEVCSDRDFQAMRRSVTARGAGRHDLSAWNDLDQHSVHPVDLRLPRATVSPAAVQHLRALLAQASDSDGLAAASLIAVRARADVLVAALVGGEPLTDPLRGLVGAGPGTTPSGDDIIVGVLAGLRATGDDSRAHALELATRPLLPRTTEASRHYLRHAMNGAFAEHVHHAIAALSGFGSVPSLVADAQAWGATSGTDLLHGIAAGLVPTAAERLAA